VDTKVQESFQNTKQDYVDYLQTIPWTFFYTASTKYELTIKSYRRLMERFFKVIGAGMMFHVAEKFELKDGFHGHGLLKISNKYGSMDPDNKFLFRFLIDEWQLMSGNKAISNKDGIIEWSKEGWASLNLKRYNPKRGAGGYCAKYIFKDHADYDLLIPDTSLINDDYPDYDIPCPSAERKRRDSIYHIGRALQPCNSIG